MELTKEEQLRKVFTKKIKILLEDFELAMRFNILISPDDLIEDIVSNLLYEVKMRTDLKEVNK